MTEPIPSPAGLAEPVGQYAGLTPLEPINVDAENTQEPCGICSGYGCPDCREETDRAYLSFDGMCWPNPNDPREVEWTLRHGTPTPAQLRIAASMVAAYKQLVADPQRARNSKIAGIRRAVSSTGESVDG